VKTSRPADHRSATDKLDKGQAAARPASGPGNTEATRPRDKRDETQRGPGNAGADMQMTADGGTDVGNQRRGRSKR
jgi:hypothetical protein